MKTRYIFTLCLCAALLFSAFQVGISAETEIDRTNRRDPFASLLIVPAPPEGPLPSKGPQKTILQQHELKQFRVIGIVLGELGHYAIVSAPDGKRYMISKGTPIGLYDGTVSEIAPNSILVTEMHRFQEDGAISVKEAESTLFLDPFKSPRTPESRFVVLHN